MTPVDGSGRSAERSFRAMGTDCRVLVYGEPRQAEVLADLARRRVEILEATWSRFRPDSELSRLNARAGSGSVEVSGDTLTLVHAMLTGWERTEGAFDPSVLAAIRAAGYDRDFADVIASASVAGIAERAPGMADVMVGDHRVTLPAGIGLDPGAIGKGLAADIVVDELMRTGIDGVLVDLGGDIALAGAPGDAPGWNIEIVDERSRKVGASVMRRIAFPSGIERAGVATSTSLTRRWADARHHVIDPVTGASTDEMLVQVTCAGQHAWECEVWATAVLVRADLVGRLPEGISTLALGRAEVVRDDFIQADDRRKVA